MLLLLENTRVPPSELGTVLWDNITFTRLVHVVSQLICVTREPVAFYLPRSALLSACLVACVKHRRPWYLLDVDWPHSYLLAQLKQIDAAVVVSCRAVVSAVPDSRVGSQPAAVGPQRIQLLDTIVGADSSHCIQCFKRGCGLCSKGVDAPLYLAFTSGSTSFVGDHGSGGSASKCVAASSVGTASRLSWYAVPILGPHEPGASQDAAHCRRSAEQDGNGTPLLETGPRRESSFSVSGQSRLQEEFDRLTTPSGHGGRPSVDVGLWKAPVSFVDTVAEALTGLCVPCACGFGMGSDGTSRASPPSSSDFPTVILPEDIALRRDVNVSLDSAEPITMSVAAAVSRLAQCLVTCEPYQCTPRPDPSSNGVSRAVVDIGRLHWAISRYRVSRLTAVPALLSALASYDQALVPAFPEGKATAGCLSSLRVVHSSGDVLTARTAADFMSRLLASRGMRVEAALDPIKRDSLPRLVNVYGSAETSADCVAGDVTGLALALLLASPVESGAVAGHELSLQPWTPLPVGSALPGSSSEVRCSAPDGAYLYTVAPPAHGSSAHTAPESSSYTHWLRPVSPTGRVIVRGDLVALGYAKPASDGSSQLVIEPFLSDRERNDTIGSSNPPSLLTNQGRVFVTSDLGRFVAVCRGEVDSSVIALFPYRGQLPPTCPCGCAGPVQLQILGRIASSDDVHLSAGDASSVGHPALRVIQGLRSFKRSGAMVSLDEVEAATLSINRVRSDVVIGDGVCAHVDAHPTFALGFPARTDAGASSLELHVCVGLSILSTPTSAAALGEGSSIDLKELLATLAAAIASRLADALPSHMAPSPAHVHPFVASLVANDGCDAAAEAALLAALPALPCTPSGKPGGRLLASALEALLLSASDTVASAPAFSSIASGDMALTAKTVLLRCVAPALRLHAIITESEPSLTHPSSSITITARSHLWDEAGLDSLSAVVLVGALNDLLRGVANPASVPAITFDDVRQHPTADQLAALMASRVHRRLDASAPETTATSAGGHGNSLPSGSVTIAGSFAPTVRRVQTWERGGVRNAWLRASPTAPWAEDVSSASAVDDPIAMPASDGASRAFTLVPMWASPLGRCVDGPALVVRLTHDGLPPQRIAIVGSHACTVTVFRLDDLTTPLLGEEGALHSGPSPLWTVHLPDRVEAAPVLHLPTGSVAIACYDGAVYGLCLASGVVLWRIPAAADAASDGTDPPTKRARRAHVEVDEEVHNADDATASDFADSDERTPLKAAPAVDQVSPGVIWVAGYDRQLRGFVLRPSAAAASGRLTAECNGGFRFSPQLFAPPLPLPGSVACTPAVMRSSSTPGSGSSSGIVVACTSGDVMQVTTAAGIATTTWRVTLPGPVFGSPLCFSDPRVIIVPCADGCVYGLATGSGAWLWRVQTAAPVFAGPAWSDAGGRRLAVCGSHDGYVRGISVTDGAVVWATRVSDASPPAPVFASPASFSIGRGRLAVVAAATDGSMAVLDAATGGVVALARLSGRPAAAAATPSDQHSAGLNLPASSGLLVPVPVTIDVAARRRARAGPSASASASAIQTFAAPVVIDDGLLLIGARDDNLWALQLRVV